MGPLNYKTAFSKSFNTYHPISQVGLVFAPAVFVGLWFLLTLFKDHRWGNNKLFSIPTRPLLKFVKEKAYVEHLNLRILLKVIKKQEVLQSDDLQNKIVWNNNLQQSSLERQFVKKKFWMTICWNVFKNDNLQIICPEYQFAKKVPGTPIFKICKKNGPQKQFPKKFG